MLNLKQILNNLNKFPGGLERVGRTDYVRVTGLQRGISRLSKNIRFIARTSTPEKMALGIVLQKYTSMIEFLDSEHVKVSCTCPDFWATWEWALTRRGASDIRYSNGDPPDSRNPRYIAGCCKHLVKMIDTCVRNGYFTPDFTLK